MAEPLAPRCAVPGCGVTIESGKLMCKEHWLLLPVAMRRQVKRRWNGFCRAQGEDRRSAFSLYSASRRTAVGKVQSLLP